MKKILLLLAVLLSLFSCEKKENNISLSSIEKPIQKEETNEEQIKKMVNVWNEASSNADFDTLEKILGDKIEYYQSSVTKTYYISDQKKFFANNPVYGQKIKGDITVTQISNTYKYDEPVTIVGTFGIKEFETETGIQKPYVLKLSSPITVVANGEDEFNETETNQSIIQMAPSEEHINYLKSHNAYGKRIQVTGSFYHSHTGHHFTPALISVSEVKILN